MKKNIMVVDDEDSLLQLMDGLLSNAGYNVSTARSGDECLKKLEKEKPDLLILDMMMPGMSGRKVVENIRKNKNIKNLKIVFLTVARFSEAGKDVLTKFKVLDYITKPFETEELLKRIKKIV